MKPARTAASLVILLALAPGRGGEAAETVSVEPEVWNYGVRPQRHLVTTTVRFRPGVGLRARIGLVQINCSCLAAKVVREAGTHDGPPALELTMDTERFEGRTRHYAFVNLIESGKPDARLVRVEVTGWTRPGEGAGGAEVFFAGGEPAGASFMEWWRANAATAEGASRVKLLPIENVANYTRMRGLERRAELPGPAADVIAFVDGVIALRGEDEVKAGLAGFLNLARDGRPGSLHPGGDSPAPRPEQEEARVEAVRPAPGPDKPVEAAPVPAPGRHDIPPATGADAGALEVEIYYFSDCRHCREALALARRVESDLGGSVRFTTFDTAAKPEAVPRLFALAKAYPGTPAVLPSMVALVGDRMLAGEERILAGLEGLVAEQLARGGAHLGVRRPPGEASPAEAVGIVTLAPVVLAGLADGVNPCAFAAMVLLISVLSASGAGPGAGSPRRDLLLGGGAFLAGVFAAYFLAGLALFRGARAIEGWVTVEAVVFWAVWGLAVAGAALSGADAVTYFKTRDAARVRLKVPAALRRRFAGIIRGRFGRSGLVLGGLAGGVVIALLEGVCTGQMYLPAIRYMAGTPGLRSRGVQYLLLYNALFTLPLAAILAAAVAGVHFRRMNALLRRHLAAAKVLLALVFLALAVAMVWQRLSAPSAGPGGAAIDAPSARAYGGAGRRGGPVDGLAAEM